MLLSKRRRNDYIYVYILLIPVMCRWLFLDTWEENLTINFLEYPLFVPEISFFLLPFYHNKFNSRFKKIAFISFLGLVYILLGCFANDIETVYLNFIGGSDFFVTTLIMALYPLDKRHFKIIRWPLLISLLLLGLEVFLFSTVLTYKGLEGALSYGALKRISTTVGASTGTGVIIFMLSSISYYCFFDKKFIQKIILVISTIAIIFTLSRGAIIVQLLFIMYVALKKVRMKGRLDFLKFLALTFIIVIFSLKINEKYNVVSSLTERVSNSIDSSDISSGRIDRYIMAYELFLQQPLIGNGSCSLNPYSRARSLDVDSMYGLSPHNFYLLFLVDYGFFGFILLLIVLSRFLKISFASGKLNILNFSFILLLIVIMNIEIIFMTMNFLFLFYLMALISRYELK